MFSSGGRRRAVLTPTLTLAVALTLALALALAPALTLALTLSSGNGTEKARVARRRCEGETVVDLYAGIGYFALPYLVHARAAHLHACEWDEVERSGVRVRVRVKVRVRVRVRVRAGTCTPANGTRMRWQR